MTELISLKYHLRNLLFLKQKRLPRVSIIVPLYNEERFVIETLKSIKLQFYKNFECLIINDCSTDHSVEVTEKYIKGDKRFKLIHHEQNKGLAASRNTGIAESTGEYIQFLDSDDLLTPFALFRKVNAIQKKNSKFVAGSYSVIKPEKENFPFFKTFMENNAPTSGKRIDFISCHGECPFPVHAPLLKTEIIKSAGGFDESLKLGAEDWNTWYKILRNGYIFIPAKNVGGVYRQKSQSMIKSLAIHHVTVAKNLIHKSYTGCEGQELVMKDSPYYFSKPVFYYSEILVLFKRCISAAIFTALSTKDEKLVSQILDFFDDKDTFVGIFYSNIEVEVEKALKRYNNNSMPPGFSFPALKIPNDKKSLLDYIMKIAEHFNSKLE